jgi:lipopolysaccharide transport system permease protein
LSKAESDNWDLIVKPTNKWFSLNFKELWAYKDLIVLLVKRDLTAVYKQTILGPLWMFIQPAFTTAIYTFTFSITANLSTDGIPPVLFYLIGQTFWSYFSDCLLKTSGTFITNASVFGKVYFPRLVMPLSVVMSNLVKLGVQMLLMIVVFVYYYFTTNQIKIQVTILLLPVFVMLMGLFGLGIGIIFSSFTTKYRDLNFLIGFAIQLLMFASCIVFPVSMYSQKVQAFLMLSPIVTIIEAIRFCLTGHGNLSVMHLLIATGVIMLTLLIGAVIFTKTERTFMDTV